MEHVLFGRFARVCVASIVFTGTAMFLVTLPMSAPASVWLEEAATTTSAVDDVIHATTLTIPQGEFLSYSHLSTSSRDFAQLINLTDFKFLREAPYCDPERPPQLLAVVHSAPKNFLQRSAIRETWGAARPGFKLVFMLGYTSSLNLQKMISREHVRHRDIVQGNFVDSYRNMTYKHVMAFKWIVYNCGNVSHVLKIDDDVFVHMPNFLDFLPSLPSAKLIFCDVIFNALAKRSWRSKWHVSFSEYAPQKYPNYCAGWVVVYSGDVIRTLYSAAQKHAYFWIDDVHVTGVLALKTLVTHQSAKQWTLGQKDSERIVSKNKWPNERYFFGPYDSSPKFIRALWRVLSEENIVS